MKKILTKSEFNPDEWYFSNTAKISTTTQLKLIDSHLGNADDIDNLSKEVGDDVKNIIKDVKKNKNDVKGNLDHMAKVL